MMSIRVLFLSVLLLNGCAMVPWVKAPTGEYKDGARKFTAQLPQDWMRYTRAQYFIMTRDGIVLDSVTVERRKIDEPLAFTKKKFTKSMLINEIADVEIDDYKSGENIFKFNVVSNEPVKIANQDGFRLEYTYETSSGLIKQGIHYGFLYDGMVYRIMYDAAQQYYYKQNLGVFEKFLESFRLI